MIRTKSSTAWSHAQFPAKIFYLFFIFFFYNKPPKKANTLQSQSEGGRACCSQAGFIYHVSHPLPITMTVRPLKSAAACSQAKPSRLTVTGLGVRHHLTSCIPSAVASIPERNERRALLEANRAKRAIGLLLVAWRYAGSGPTQCNAGGE